MSSVFLYRHPQNKRIYVRKMTGILYTFKDVPGQLISASPAIMAGLFIFMSPEGSQRMTMHTNPHNWPGLHELIQSWWRGETPVGAILLAMFMAVLRIAYTGGGWRRMILEGLLCGALTLTVASALAYFDWPRTATIAIGGSVGFIGVDSLRTFVLRFIGNRIGVKDDSERGPGHTK